jgi:hypothetical protein
MLEIAADSDTFSSEMLDQPQLRGKLGNSTNPSADQ